MSEIIEHRMEYLPVRIAHDGSNMNEYITAVAGNMLIVREQALDELVRHPNIPSITAGHIIILRDPANTSDKFLAEVEPQYPDEHGYSRKFHTTIDEAIGYAAQLRSLVRLKTGKFMQLAVLDYGDTDLIGELREMGYAPKVSE